MKIARLPKDDKTNGWSGILAPRTPKPALAQDTRADWAIVGSGYAGLAAARRLAELHPDQHIAVVEAGQAGENASGRNSGFAIDLPHNVGSSLEELEGPQRYMRLARSAIAALDETVQTHSIPCDWSRDGKYHAAVSPRGVDDVLRPLERELSALGEPFEWVHGAELAKRLGSTHFTSAIYTPGGALLNPAALVRGLADSLPANVTLYENTPVTSFDSHNGIELTTPMGALKAPKMILAANGFAEQFGHYKNRIIHLAGFGSLSRPLTKDEREAFGNPAPWGLTPANAFAGITLRYTNDHRILIRQGLTYAPNQRIAPSQMARVKATHQRLLGERFPAIAGTPIEHTWAGFVALTRNSAPGFGQVAGNIWAATCQNAVGVTKGTFSGTLAADLASGVDNPLVADMLALGEPSPLPPRPFFDLGIRARFKWELFSNRHEA